MNIARSRKRQLALNQKRAGMDHDSRVHSLNAFHTTTGNALHYLDTPDLIVILAQHVADIECAVEDLASLTKGRPDVSSWILTPKDDPTPIDPRYSAKVLAPRRIILQRVAGELHVEAQELVAEMQEIGMEARRPSAVTRGYPTERSAHLEP